MEKSELQKLIKQTNHSAEQMRIIGESYIKGDILEDPVAAEAWLLRAIEQGEGEDAVLAMGLIVRAIYGQNKVIRDEDYLEIRKEWQQAAPNRKKYLEQLLNLGTEEQKAKILQNMEKVKM